MRQEPQAREGQLLTQPGTARGARGTNKALKRAPGRSRQRRYSTQECFYQWDAQQDRSRGSESFVCVGCRPYLERDPNAARVVLKRGLAIAGLAAPTVGLDTPNSACGDGASARLVDETSKLC